MADSLDTIWDAHTDNADYDADASVAKAKLFRTACRRLVARLPSESSRGGPGGRQSMAFSIEQIAQQLQEVEAWLALNDVTSYPVTHPDFSYSRGDL